ncbi:S8 family peptidase [Brevibacillus dissolubilis]|uniref:S8 family peptidase n=1 Tax=Brevibacillus dissolubilis TaxID=1844116 RepID=UPI0011178A80|nr:S8 family serine peptidase [Brevibacillus dissolubilis]
MKKKKWKRRGRTAVTSISAVALLVTLYHPQPAHAAYIAPNDKYYHNQTHLKQIRADRMWTVSKGTTAIKIAVLDSGVDATHPDLQGNLLPTINLVPKEPARDMKGHGTQVAGIIGAKGNNGIGVSGVMWSAKILPIKVLDKQGETDTNTLAKGIYRAVSEGAKVICMSAAYLYHAPALEEAVNYAEEKGVVVVAASGNEGDRVDYPAAYPTVISVGSVNGSNVVTSSSNYGPEIDIVAPGVSIYTTAMSGKYSPMTGTSAATPQVAAAAAMVLSRQPFLTPLEVRQILFGSATDIAENGWDRKSGHGLLNIEKAVRSKLSSDISEPNNTQSKATPFPIESQNLSRLGPYDTIDWFYTDVPYDGKLVFTASVTSKAVAPIAATFYMEGRGPVTYYLADGDTLTIPTQSGRLFYKLERGSGSGDFAYTLTNRFTIGPDGYERNNEKTAYRSLPPGNRVSVTGNFNVPGDTDWYSYYVRSGGKLNIVVAPDTRRMDPVVAIYKEGDKNHPLPPFDNGTPKDPTERILMDVTPGRYFIKVSNYIPTAVNGEYKLDLTYTPERADTNEPNDTYRQATKLGTNSFMTGTLATRSDYDWYSFRVSSDSYVTIRAPYIPVDSGVRLTMYNQSLDYVLFSEDEVAQFSKRGRNIFEMKLKPGTYYIRLDSAKPFKYDSYRIQLIQQPLISGYRDISTHWAKKEIVRLTQKGIVKGFSDYAFRPDKGVTRAEFATMLLRAMKSNGLEVGKTGSNPFRDLSRKHWAYSSIMQVSELGIMQGYENNTVQPDRVISRAEMAVMVARAKHMLLYPRQSSYRDVKRNFWAAPAIEILTLNGWLKGYKDGTFRPNQAVRRGEMAVFLSKAFRL